MRSGKDYVAALRDGRAVYLDGELVRDVTGHPAFSAPIRKIAEIYDRAREPASLDATSYVDPESGQRYSAKWLIPRSTADLDARRCVHRFWADATFGHMGRTPDHVASAITAFAAGAEVFARGGARFAEHVRRFYERARREDLYLAYVIVPPQVDRSKPAHQQPDPHLYAGVVEERDDGIVVRGAQMIGTSAVMADYVFLSYIVPLQRGDEDYAISIVLPCSAPGLRIYPRRPYATMATTVYDYPLSSRLDEIDSLIVLHDVFVPWEHVFVYRDVELTNAQFHETGAHVLANFQSLVRFAVKMRFLTAAARRLCELHGIAAIPPVQALVGGEIALASGVIDALVLAAVNQPVIRDGVAGPSPQFVYDGMAYQRQVVTEVMRAIRELCGGGVIAVPSSSAAFTSPETGEDAARYYRSASATAEERVRVLKLVWDLIGTEFAGRQLQYEMFYSAAKQIVEQRVYRHYPWEEAEPLLEACLSGYGLEGAPAAETRRGAR